MRLPGDAILCGSNHLQGGEKKKIKSFGLLILGIYLICVGLGTLFGIGIPSAVMGILALVAGLLLIVGR